MGQVILEQAQLPDYEGSYKGKIEGEFRILKVGEGDSVFYTDKEGSRWGSVVFNNANAYIKIDGTYKFRKTTGETIMDETGLGIDATSNLISIQGWSFSGTFSASDADTVAWTSGTITLADGTTFSINAGNTGNMAAVTYIYFNKAVSTTVLQTTTTAGTAVGANKILICVANKETDKLATFQAFGGKGVGVLITADNIAAGTITSNEIATNTITANEILAGTITALEIAANAITATKIAANAVTADKINVSTLSAISADIGTVTAGTITGATIRTAASGYRAVMTSANGFQLYNGATLQGTIKADTAASMILASAGNIYLYNNGNQMAFFTGDSVDFPGGYDITFSGQGRLVPSGGYLEVEGSTGGIWGLRINGNVFPAGDNEHTCGASDSRWSGGWFEDISVDDLDVNVSLDKPGGSFTIDHPLKPLTHILRHSFVESPDMLNLYKGRGKTVNGKCEIELPDYFEALNKDIEYQLTPIKSLAKLSIGKEVENNKFEVISDIDCEFSWLVMGIRQDKFAEENRIIVEEEKAEPQYMYGGYVGEERNRYSEVLKKTRAKRPSGKYNRSHLFQ